MKGNIISYDSETEYIEVTEGIAYFILDYVPQGDDIDFHIGFMPTDYEDDGASIIVSNQSTPTTGGTYYAIRNHNRYRFRVNCNTSDSKYNTTRNEYPLNTRHEISVLGTENRAIFDGVSVDMTYSKSDIVNDKPFIFFNRALLGRQTWGRLYYFKVEKAGVLVCDIIPVRIGNKGLLYDKVSGKLFSHSGTGKIIIGPDIK